MPTDVAVNDAILQPYLMAQDTAECQRQLISLLSEHAEARMRGIISSRFRSYLRTEEHHAELDDVYSEAKTRLLAYLRDLKAGNRNTPCEDFTGYVSTIAHNVCHDHFRQTHPTRARLQKKIRDLFRANQKFAIWRTQDQKKGEWLCGFHRWQGLNNSSVSSAWLHRFYEHPEIVSEALSSGDDIQSMETADLLTAVFTAVGEPLSLTDVVNVVSDIKGVKDSPTTSFDANGVSLISRLPDSSMRVDSVLEMREPLTRVWGALCELPRDQFIAYLLHGRDTSGENLITLFIDAKITTDSEVASLLEMTLAEFLDLCANRLPMDNDAVARELGIKVQRVYKLRCEAGKRLKKILSDYR